MSSSNTNKRSDYGTIQSRLSLINELVTSAGLGTTINLEDGETEAFIGKSTGEDYHFYYDDFDNGSTDTRKILNKKLFDFYKVIGDLGGKLTYVKSGASGHTFRGITTIDGNKINFGVKVVAYSRKKLYGEMNDIKRPENAELLMIRLLSYFVIKKKTPHIVLPIGTFNTSIEPFTELIKNGNVKKDNEKYLEFLDRYNKGEYHDDVSILMSEWANNGDLLEFVRKHYKEISLIEWKVMFFQIISALAVIQSKYPSFRHNDLKANNILVHKVEKRNTKFQYTVNKKKYMIPNIGYQMKLWDFDFACIPGIVDNAKVEAEWTDAINVDTKQNRYYDMHYFFNTFIKRGFFHQFMEDSSIPIEAKEFVDRVVPKKYQSGKYVSKKGRILKTDEYTTPDIVLRTDPFFEEFRWISR